MVDEPLWQGLTLTDFNDTCAFIRSVYPKVEEGKRGKREKGKEGEREEGRRGVMKGKGE